MLINIRETIKDIRNFFVLLILVMFTYSLLGMELFANKSGGSRINFDDFHQSTVAIFIILIGEDWNNIMYTYMLDTRPYANAIFFISLIIVGNLVLLNLFLAILLKNFENHDS